MQHRSRWSLTLFVLVFVGCNAEVGPSVETRHPERLYPRPPQVAWVVALGDLQPSAGFTPAQVQMAMFLFGEEPPPPFTLMKPTDVAVCDDGVIIADGPLAAIFRYQQNSGRFVECSLGERPKLPAAVCIAGNNDLLVADSGSAEVHRFKSNGSTSTPGQYRLTSNTAAFRPSGVACVGEEVWVANAVGHCIEVFRAATGEHLRTLGRRGDGHLEFCFPMGMAVTPRGDVCVVDMLNHRVQVISPDGRWLRNVGRAGDAVGCFGRPKDVAVGPDGTIFVTDASCGRVQAFDEAGRPLLAFGEPDGGIGALLIPSGIAISVDRLGALMNPPADFVPQYYVLVAEQMLRPGIRTYAWRSVESARSDAQKLAERESARRGAVADASPHWMRQRCSACHAVESGAPAPIAREKVDSLCLSCHDGQRARAEAHPIGRLAATNTARVPDHWPTVDGRISCLTCHDLSDHCNSETRRPLANPAFVRAFDPDHANTYCFNCHREDASKRISPHQQLTASGGRIDRGSCLFCHVKSPEIPKDGVRTGNPGLRATSSTLCLSCHVRHWDVSERGHVDRPAGESVVRRLNAQEASATGAEGSVATGSERLPLTDGRVTCYSCHNPHQQGLFASGSAMDLHASTPEDSAVALRLNRAQLCAQCHVK